MKPKLPPIKDKQGHLFKIELVRIINKAHPMVKLANAIDWDRLKEVFGKSYCPDNGRPAISTRLMIAITSNTLIILVMKIRYWYG